MSRSAGFSLLEVLIALAIFALALQGVVWVFTQQSAGLMRAQRLQFAVALAESVLDRLGKDIPLAYGERRGEDANGLRWRAQISPYQATPSSGTTRLYAVKLAILSEQEAVFELDAVRIGVAPP